MEIIPLNIVRIVVRLNWSRERLVIVSKHIIISITNKKGYVVRVKEYLVEIKVFNSINRNNTSKEYSIHYRKFIFYYFNQQSYCY